MTQSWAIAYLIQHIKRLPNLHRYRRHYRRPENYCIKRLPNLHRYRRHYRRPIDIRSIIFVVNVKCTIHLIKIQRRLFIAAITAILIA